MRAYCLIRGLPHYRRDAFVAGLAAAGLNVSNMLPKQPGPDDVLVIWNRYAENHALAHRFERGGGRVLVAENGYLGADPGAHRPVDAQGRRLIALALHDHGGKGAWPFSDPAVVPDATRWAALGCPLEAPRPPSAGAILIAGQRGIGSPARGSPPGWHDRTARELMALRIPVRVRAHPGDAEPLVPLERDLRGVAALLVWASGAGVKALVAGVPVLHACPWFICAEAATRYRRPADLAGAVLDPAARLRALERMAWAQWTLDEIASGEPFRRLLALPYPAIDRKEIATC